MMNDIPETVLTIAAALVLAIVAAVVFYRRGRAAGYHQGYRQGWDSMKAAHDEYRARNRAALATIQNLTDSPPMQIVRPLGVAHYLTGDDPNA